MIRQLLIVALFGLSLSAPYKVDSNLQHVLTTKGSATIVVVFRQSTDIVLNKINALSFQTRGAKITAMKEQLEQLAASSQKEVLALLKARSVSYESFWINNRVFVKNADAVLVDAIADVSDVMEVREEITVHLDDPVFEDGSSINAEWNIDKIEAEAAWALPGGNNGAGVVVSSIDTGVHSTHVALQANFRADHGWYDPYDKSAAPADGHGHGTHTMGVIVGSGDIGVAPGAQWVACKGCNTASCSEAALTACGQWTACPTNADGTGSDCNLAPSISSNSWGGGQGNLWYETIVNAWHAVGIIPVFALGNSGSGCGSASSPGDMTNVIGVGSTTNTDAILPSSSRGPAQNGAIKPDIVAPGQGIRSSWYSGGAENDEYQFLSGSSSATPHISGTIALILAHDDTLNYDQIKTLIFNNAHRNQLGDAPDCGGVENKNFPNNVYGHGRINARASLSAAITGF